MVLTVRFLLSTGPVLLGQYTLNLPSDRSFWSFQTPLTNGYMLAVTCMLNPLSATRAKRGQCFVQGNVVRPGVLAGASNFVLFSDYISTDFFASWPSYTQRSSIDGRGYMFSLNQAAPAAGQGATVTVPSNALWIVQSFGVRLATSATAGNRTVQLIIQDWTGVGVFLDTCEFTQAASLTVTYTWGRLLGTNQTAIVSNFSVQRSLPDLRLLAASTVKFSVTGMAASDQIQVVQATGEEFLSP
jgi:hypothetical protein